MLMKVLILILINVHERSLNLNVDFMKPFFQLTPVVLAIKSSFYNGLCINYIGGASKCKICPFTTIHHCASAVYVVFQLHFLMI